MKKIPIIAVVGPTASGKTALSVALAKELNAEIISFDSMQIYKDMHIASAAPDEEEREGIQHHLLEFLEPEKSFSVADFIAAATDCVADVISRGKAVIITGGTGLYINSFLDNVCFSKEGSDDGLREQLNAEYDRIGGEAMIDKLKQFDLESAQRLHPNNKKRVIRAFEIYLKSGITMTEQIKNSLNTESPYIPFILGLNFKNREKLYERINTRVDRMLEIGLLEEARHTFERRGSGTAVQAIGHKEFFPYFKGEIGLEDAVELLKRETRRYAKRQLTWFRRDERIRWIYCDETENITAESIKLLEGMGYFGKTS